MNSVATIMDDYANALAERYGVEVADEIVQQSHSSLNLSVMSNMPLITPTISRTSYNRSRGRYDSIGGRAPEVVVDN